MHALLLAAMLHIPHGHAWGWHRHHPSPPPVVCVPTAPGWCVVQPPIVISVDPPQGLPEATP